MSSALAEHVRGVHLELIPQSASVLIESADSWEDRRGSIRRTMSELSWLHEIRLQYGPRVSLIDLSSGGAQIETTNCHFQPGGTVVIELMAGTETFCIPSLVLRAYMSRVSPTATYRSRLLFKRPFDVPAFHAANAAEGDRELNVVHEYARLNVALWRLDETLFQVGRSPGVARGALAAALAILESPTGRRAGTMFSREMSRLFRILTAAITDGTAPGAMLTQLVEALRRAVPSPVVRIVPGESLAGTSPEAICFNVPSADGGCAGRIVVEFPRGCQLEPWHVSLLKATAHLVTVVNQIDALLRSRQQAAAEGQARGVELL